MNNIQRNWRNYWRNYRPTRNDQIYRNMNNTYNDYRKPKRTSKILLIIILVIASIPAIIKGILTLGAFFTLQEAKQQQEEMRESYTLTPYEFNFEETQELKDFPYNLNIE